MRIVLAQGSVNSMATWQGCIVNGRVETEAAGELDDRNGGSCDSECCPQYCEASTYATTCTCGSRLAKLSRCERGRGLTRFGADDQRVGEQQERKFPKA